MRLRPYQKSASDFAFKEWESASSTLIVLPTGCGKTIVFADIIQKTEKKALVLAHRGELIWQARDKIEKMTGLKADIEMAGFKSSMDSDLFKLRARVIVATVQTLTMGGDGSGRLSKFNPDDFDLVVIDECHRGVADSYRRVMDWFKKNKNLKFLGVTATPDRTDEEALGQIFETVAFNYEILDAIKDGWLVPIEQELVSVDSIDISNVRTTAGDLNGADLAEVFEQEKPLLGIVDATRRIAGNKRTLGFTASVEQARLSSNICNRYQSGTSAWVCGKTDADERKKIITDFAADKIQFIWNCGVFTEGFDDSGVEIIAMARPTKSRSLYSQMAGRSTRPHESIAHQLNNTSIPALRRSMIAKSCKPCALIIDFVGNSGRHKLMTTADILGGNYSDEAIEKAIEKALRVGGRMRMDKTIEEEEKQIEERKKRALEEQARKASLVARSSFKTQSIDPFDIYQIKPAPARGWDKGKIATEGQKNVLRKIGLNPDDYTYSEIKTLVREQIERWNKNLCTFKQAKWLKERGYSSKTTFDDARKIIDAWARRNWKRPPNSELPSSGEGKHLAKVSDDSDVPF